MKLIPILLLTFVLLHATSAADAESFLCKSCKAIMTGITEFNITSIERLFEDLFDKACTMEYDAVTCAGLVELGGPVVFESLYHHYTDPALVCGLIHACPRLAVQNTTGYIEDLIADKPNKPWPQPNVNTTKTFKVAHVSDFHWDWAYQEGAPATCSQSMCCRPTPGVNSSGPTAGFWGTPNARCDAPLRLVEEAVRFIGSLDPDMVVWTGDNAAHDPLINRAQDINATLTITRLFQQYLPDESVAVLSTIGNHETYPMEMWDFWGNNNDDFKDEISEAWEQWIGLNGSTIFKQNGFYSTRVERLGVRVISLNTEACNWENLMLLRDPTDPGNMLAWLVSELQSAEDNDELVYIIGHVASGVNNCFEEWATRYTAIVDRFSYIIRGQFFGHTHSDQFELYRSFVDNSTIGSLFMAPSVTTNSNRFPTVRLYEIDAETLLPLNYYQYYLNVTEVNAQGITEGPLNWGLLYDFKSEYGYDWPSLENLEDLMEKVLTDDDVYRKYGGNMNTRYSSGLPGRQGPYCGQNSIYGNAVTCMGQHENYKTAGFLLKLLAGPWHVETTPL